MEVVGGWGLVIASLAEVATFWRMRGVRDLVDGDIEGVGGVEIAELLFLSNHSSLLQRWFEHLGASRRFGPVSVNFTSLD